MATKKVVKRAAVKPKPKPKSKPKLRSVSSNADALEAAVERLRDELSGAGQADLDLVLSVSESYRILVSELLNRVVPLTQMVNALSTAVEKEKKR